MGAYRLVSCFGYEAVWRHDVVVVPANDATVLGKVGARVFADLVAAR